jgi:hypothetical protein
MGFLCGHKLYVLNNGFKGKNLMEHLKVFYVVVEILFQHGFIFY